jgi:hypothetical protein
MYKLVKEQKSSKMVQDMMVIMKKVVNTEMVNSPGLIDHAMKVGLRME